MIRKKKRSANCDSKSIQEVAPRDVTLHPEFAIQLVIPHNLPRRF